MRYKIGLIMSVIILLLVVFNLPTKEEQELKTDKLIAYIDGRRTDTIPTKSNDITVDRIVCDNNADAEWDNTNWGIFINSITNNSTKCSVYFKTFPAPELYTGLIPVTYDASGNTVVADTTTTWYDYDNHIWANAVLGTSSARAKTAGQTLSDSEILQYYVWIPRYRYQLFSTGGSAVSQRKIVIEFENKNKVKSNGSTTGQWLTHPAFTFGSTELNGIWVGKFEPSHSDTSNVNSSTTNSLLCSDENCSLADGIIIKPNVSSIRKNNISYMFYASRSISRSGNPFGISNSSVNSHMMKNVEWSAVAYLTNSEYGRCTNNSCVEINRNNTTDYYTGYGATRAATTGYSSTSVDTNRFGTHNSVYPSGDSMQGQNIAGDWLSSYGFDATTTGNISGIYDMSGGAHEYVMGNMLDSNGDLNPSSSGFVSSINNKYYDDYPYSEAKTSDYASIGKLGDATKETRGWYGDAQSLPYAQFAWILRSGYCLDGTTTGIFYFSIGEGSANISRTFRVVLTAEDN